MNKKQPKQRSYKGTVTEWDEQGGYGFILTDTSNVSRIFFHISAYVGQNRPVKGDVVIFCVGKKDGRIQANKVKPQFELEQEPTTKPRKVRQQKKQKFNFKQTFKRVFTKIKLFFSVAVVAGWFLTLWRYAPSLFYFYATCSVILLLMYGLDKRAASRERWRTSEFQLHLFAIIGGWSGGMIGRYLFNHKTSKISFIWVFWLTVAMNIIFTYYAVFINSDLLSLAEGIRQKIIIFANEELLPLGK